MVSKLLLSLHHSSTEDAAHVSSEQTLFPKDTLMLILCARIAVLLVSKCMMSVTGSSMFMFPASLSPMMFSMLFAFQDLVLSLLFSVAWPILLS